MFSAEKIKAYKKISDSKPISFLLNLIKKYLSGLGWKSHTELAEILEKILESTSDEEDVRLDRVFQRLSNSLSHNSSTDIKFQPMSIKGDFFSLLLVFFRLHPQLFQFIKPSPSVYVLLLLGIFSYDTYSPENIILDEKNELTTSFIKSLPYFPEYLLGEIVESCTANSFNIPPFKTFQALPTYIFAEFYRSLQMILMQSGALTYHLNEKIVTTFRRNAMYRFENFKKADGFLVSFFSEFYKLSDFSIPQQREIFNFCFKKEPTIQSICEAVSMMNKALFIELIDVIADKFLNTLDNERVDLFLKMICRWMSDDTIDKPIPKSLLKFFDKIKLDGFYSYVPKNIMVCSAIVRSTADIYFNYQNQKKLVDAVFSKIVCYKEQILETIEAILPDLYDVTLKYLCNKLIELCKGLIKRSRVENIAMSVFNLIIDNLEGMALLLSTVIPTIKARGLNDILIPYFVESINDLIDEKYLFETPMLLSHINALIVLEKESLITESVKIKMIEKMEPNCFYDYMSAHSNYDLEKTIPPFFQILSTEQQKQLLTNLQKGGCRNYTMKYFSKILIAVRHLPVFSEKIFKDLVDTTKDLSLSSLICRTKLIDQINAIEKSQLLQSQLQLLLSMKILLKDLISIILSYSSCSNNEDDKLAFRHKLAQDRERNEFKHSNPISLSSSQSILIALRETGESKSINTPSNVVPFTASKKRRPSLFDQNNGVEDDKETQQVENRKLVQQQPGQQQVQQPVNVRQGESNNQNQVSHF